jgi:alkanesulfonate monooxygenase SsuD/methylene tetrahydromethanopterin reductase-like flavin-dependent oxidoreductase (luciferase family)
MMVNKVNNLTFGIMLAPAPPWSVFVEQARQVVSLGFDKIWLPDHFVNPEDVGMDWFECWTSLAMLAALTEKITLGTLVSSMTLRNPALLARKALTVDHISGGRLELGVGAGGAPDCHKMTGIPFWERDERSKRYHEFIEILDQMLGNEVTTYEGDFFNIQGALMRPAPVSKPRPVFNVAAHGPKALRLAGRYGDSWNSYYPGKDLTPIQNSQVTHERCERLSTFAVEAGRDPERIGRTFCFGWTSDGPFRSMDAFYDAIGRYREAGIRDFCFIYALGIESWKDQTITTEDLLEQIALEIIPTLRNDSQAL